MGRKNVYAVRAGYRPGLYYSWEECRSQVHGYSGAEFRGFSTVEEARDYLSGRWNPPNNKDRKRHNNTHQPIRQQQQQQSFAPAHYSDSYSDDDSDTYSDYSDDDYGHGRVEYTGYAVEVPSVVYRVGLAQAVGPRSTPPSRQPAGLAQVSGARAAAPAHHHVGHVARASGTQSASAPVIVHTCGIAIAGPVAGNSGRAVATNAPRRQATGGVARRGESLASRKNVYAVRAGYKPGLYYSWEECRKQVHGFSRAEFRGFNTVDEAREYLSGRWNPPSNKDQKRAQQGHHQQRPAAAAAAAAPPAYNSDSDDSSDEYWEYDDEDRSVTQWLRVCPREARGKEPRTHPSSAARTSRAEAMFMAQAMQLLDYELESEARQDRAAERWPEEDQMRNRRDQDEYDILAYIGRELDTLDYPDAPPRMRRTISELLDFMKYRADELRGYKARTTYGVFHQSSGPRLSSSPSSLCSAPMQIVVPASYYLRQPQQDRPQASGDLYATDPHDERFAWRMFSPLGQRVKCSVVHSFVNNGTVLPVNRIYHPTWIGLMEKCRARVTDEITRDLCERAQTDAGHLRRAIKRRDERGAERTIETGDETGLCRRLLRQH